MFERVSEFFNRKENALLPDVYDMFEDPKPVDMLMDVKDWKIHTDSDYGGTSSMIFERGACALDLLLHL